MHLRQRRWLLALPAVLVGFGLLFVLLFRLALPAPATPRLLLVGTDSMQTLAIDESEAVPQPTVDVGAIYRYPALAPNGQSLAYVTQENGGFVVYRLDLASGERQALHRSQNELPSYLVWSPDGAQLAILSTRPDSSLALYLAPADGAREARLISTPRGNTYFSWKADSSGLVLHSLRHPRQRGRVATYQNGDIVPTTVINDPGLFQAPAWNLDSSAFYYVAQAGSAGRLSPERVDSELTRVDPQGGQATVLAREPGAAILFMRAPGSEQIAYTTLGRQGFGPLKLVEANSEAAQLLSRPDEQVGAFFWSPDGSQLAYLTLPDDQAANAPLRLELRIVDTAAGTIRNIGSFIPSRSFAGFITYFDAFALSFSPWSPDGNYLSYGAQDGVYIVDVAAGLARRGGDGMLGLWIHATPES